MGAYLMPKKTPLENLSHRSNIDENLAQLNFT